MDHDTKNFKAACEALLYNDILAARALIAALSTDWANIITNTRPAANTTKVQAESTLSQRAPQKAKAHTPSELMGIFMRDGFVDRYTGARLIIPPLLRLLSTILPDVFPYHPNWKRGACHPVYWSLSATVDHVVPLADGGHPQCVKPRVNQHANEHAEREAKPHDTGLGSRRTRSY